MMYRGPLATLFSLVAVASAASCNLDNCERAVVGTFRGTATQSDHLADCRKVLAPVTTTSYTSTTTVTSTATVTNGGARRRAVTPSAAASPASPIPTYASACSGYARYSSACSCGGVTAGTTTVTTVATTTVTTTSATSCPTIYAQHLVPAPYLYVYVEYYHGTGYRTDPNTYPGNPTLLFEGPPITTLLPGTLSDCDALQQCANLAATDPSGYFSFDLHFLLDVQQWACVQYFGSNNDPGAFDVADPNVGTAYGYDTGY